MKVFFKYFITMFFSTSIVLAVSEAGAVWLLINPGASAQGTGEAQVAKANDAYASYYNPAGLAYIDKSQIVLQHVNWLPNLATDVYFDYLAFAYPLGNYGTLGGNIRYLSLGEQTRTNSQGIEQGTFKSYMIAGQMSYGTTITSNSSIGFSFKLFHQRLADFAVEGEGGVGTDEGSSTDIGFDVGYLLHFGKNKQHSFGLAIHNIGPPIDFIDAEQADPAPTNMKLGVKMQLSKTDVNELNLLFDMNKLLVASYPAMDWNDDGIISGSDEIAHSDEWYRGILNAWLDDWYYGGDYDESIPSSLSTTSLIGDFYYTQVDSENKGYADGRIGGYEQRYWSYVDHGDDLVGQVSFIGNTSANSTWAPNAIPLFQSGSNELNPNAAIYVPNYSGFCEETYRSFVGVDDNNTEISGTEFSMCYDADGNNYNPNGDNSNYGGHAWIDMPHDGFHSVDVYDVACDPSENYDCTVDTAFNRNIVAFNGTNVVGCQEESNVNQGQDYYSDGDPVIKCTSSPNSEDHSQMVDQLINQYGLEHQESNSELGIEVGDPVIGADGKQIVVYEYGENNQTYTRFDIEYTDEYNFNDSEYGIYNPYGYREKGSGDDRTFQKELEEVIFNLGFEYKYTENFTLRAGFIYDLEGDLKNPTLGAGIDFINYGFDFGYTLGDTGSPRSNTMFFSLKIDV